MTPLSLSSLDPKPTPAGGLNEGYHADGHRLTLQVSEGFFSVEIECPGEGRCSGMRDYGSPEPDCIVKYNLAQLGSSEFLESQERPYRETTDTPCEIEWRDWGDDGGYLGEPEYEFWWRPI